MARNQIRVSPNELWGRKVHKPWLQRVIQTFDTKQQAVSKAMQVAQSQKWELRIQKKDWSVQWWNSYWGDPFPPRDRK